MAYILMAFMPSSLGVSAMKGIKEMKSTQKREAIKQYEATMVKACDIRREAMAKAQVEFEVTKERARQTYGEATNETS